MIKGIAFDAYGTLYDVFSVAQRCELEYPENGKAISQLWREKQLEYSWLQTLMGHYKSFWHITEDALCYALDSLRLEYNEETIAEIMNAYFNLSLYPEVVESLQEFRPRKLVILTNGNAEMLNKLIDGTELNKHLDGFLSADSVRMFKPKPEVYQLAVDSLELSKEEILFVSSNGWDVAGAKSFGFTVGWVNRSNKPHEKLDVQADYVVSDLLELSKKIETL